jgi:hypothetical protein
LEVVIYILIKMHGKHSIKLTVANICENTGCGSGGLCMGRWNMRLGWGMDAWFVPRG